MSDTRTHAEWEDRQALQQAGWDITKPDSVQFNSGSETTSHRVCKLLAAGALKDRKYRIGSEVAHPDRGEIDVVGYGHPERRPVAVECETNPTDGVIEDKLDRYYRGTPFREVFVLAVDAMPAEIAAADEWVRAEL